MNNGKSDYKYARPFEQPEERFFNALPQREQTGRAQETKVEISKRVAEWNKTHAPSRQFPRSMREPLTEESVASIVEQNKALDSAIIAGAGGFTRRKSL